MNLLFRSLLKRGCKGKPFFSILQNFFQKIFRRPEGRGNSRKTRAGASQRLTFHRTNAPAGTPISQTGLQRYCFFPYLQIFLKLFFTPQDEKHRQDTQRTGGQKVEKTEIFTQKNGRRRDRRRAGAGRRKGQQAPIAAYRERKGRQDRGRRGRKSSGKLRYGQPNISGQSDRKPSVQSLYFTEPTHYYIVSY